MREKWERLSMPENQIPMPEIPIDSERKAEALERIRREVKAYRPPLRQTWRTWARLLREQIAYLSPSYWAVQGIFAAMALVLCFLARRGLEAGNVSWLDFVALGSVVAAGMGIGAITELSRSISCHMAELEQTCYFNLGQLWAMKMVVFGCGDLCVLAILSIGLPGQERVGAAALGLYFLVPFVLSNICYLFLLTAGRQPGGRWKQSVAAVFLAGLAVMPAAFPEAYSRAALPVWLAVLAGGLVLLAVEIRGMYRKLTEGGEILC